jgi:hypothetical protein
MRFYDSVDPNPINVPYMRRGSELAPTWDFSAQAQYAYALEAAGEHHIPPFSKLDLSPAPIFRECVRQTTILALERGPDCLFDNRSKQLTAYREKGESVAEELKDRVSVHVARADEFASRYFSDDARLQKEGAARLLEEMFQRRQHKMSAMLEQKALTG